MRKMRNKEDHDCVNWNTVQLWTKCIKYLEYYIILTNEKKEPLSRLLHPAQVSSLTGKEPLLPYARSVVEKFIENANRTVELESKENLELIDFYAKERVNPDQQARDGTVRDLMKAVSEKRMILWGDAGSGKTTSIEHLAYIDAKEYMLNPTAPVPVVIYLGSTTNEQESLMEYIQNKLGIDDTTLNNLLVSGGIHLYFDGFNEIPFTERERLKTKRRREITDLLDKYTEAFIVLTNRPQDSRDFAGVPVFNLLPMNERQIYEFIEKNSTSPEISKKVTQAIEEDQNLKKMVAKPLILRSLIFIAKTKGSIPKREGQIIGAFLDALFIREQHEKYDAFLDKDKINILLRRIGYETFERDKTNAGSSEAFLLEIMSSCQKDNHFSYDSLYALNLIVHLGIMEKRDGTFVFSHQSFQDYYHSQELLAKGWFF